MYDARMHSADSLCEQSTVAVHEHFAATYSVQKEAELTPPGRLGVASPSTIASENSLASARSSCFSACDQTQVMQTGGHCSVS
jgi:hypothetical protein